MHFETPLNAFFYIPSPLPCTPPPRVPNEACDCFGHSARIFSLSSISLEQGIKSILILLFSPLENSGMDHDFTIQIFSEGRNRMVEVKRGFEPLLFSLFGFKTPNILSMHSPFLYFSNSFSYFTRWQGKAAMEQGTPSTLPICTQSPSLMTYTSTIFGKALVMCVGDHFQGVSTGNQKKGTQRNEETDFLCVFSMRGSFQ